MRNFDEWFSDFRVSIADYSYYIDFNVVYENAKKYKTQLFLMNSLIGSNNIRNDFHQLINDYPSVLECIPLLLAVREQEIYCQDLSRGMVLYKFGKTPINTLEEYDYFMEKTGLFNLIQKHLIANLYDYVLGVETGLNSNGRKNRGGDLMENYIERSFQKFGITNYYKEKTSTDIERIFGIDLGSVTNKDNTIKRFDFVVKGESGCIYGIEVNFYATQGSKLNETARSYKMIAIESKNISNFKFVWFTDGLGWKSARHNLKETFQVLDDIYNLKEVDDGVMVDLFK